MICFELVMIIIDILGLAKVIINIIGKYYSFLNSVIIDKSLLFTSKL